MSDPVEVPSPIGASVCKCPDCVALSNVLESPLPPVGTKKKKKLKLVTTPATSSIAPAKEPQQQAQFSPLTWTKERWETELNDKGRWDVMVAMRGPDSFYGETLKWFTTSVLRGRVRRVFRVGGSVNPDLKLVILPTSMGLEINKGKDKRGWNAHHFIEHIEQAANWLHIPILWIKPDIWHHAFSQLSPPDAITCFLSNKEPNDDQDSLYKELETHLQKLRR